MDGEIKELMKKYDLDEDTAEKVQEFVDEGFNEDEVVELEELL